MFEYLECFDKILVTGCQRTGTTICSHIIAKDLGYKHIDEDEFDVHFQNKFEKIIRESSNIVIHCPGMSRNIHKYSNDQTAIVWMLRNKDDVINSRNRIFWQDNREKNKYMFDHIVPTGDIYDIKNWYWQTYQKSNCKNTYEIEYESLKDHRLWLDKSVRNSFRNRQWKRNGFWYWFNKLFGW